MKLKFAERRVFCTRQFRLPEFNARRRDVQQHGRKIRRVAFARHRLAIVRRTHAMRRRLFTFACVHCQLRMRVDRRLSNSPAGKGSADRRQRAKRH